jgi:hypothetical protein
VGTGEPWASRIDASSNGHAVLVSAHSPSVCFQEAHGADRAGRTIPATMCKHGKCLSLCMCHQCAPCMLHAEAAKSAQAGLQNKLDRLREEHESQDRALREVGMPANDILRPSASASPYAVPSTASTQHTSSLTNTSLCVDLCSCTGGCKSLPCT